MVCKSPGLMDVLSILLYGSHVLHVLEFKAYSYDKHIAQALLCIRTGKVAMKVKDQKQWMKWKLSSCASPWASVTQAACTW